MTFLSGKKVMALFAAALLLASQARGSDIPDWLGGRPDDTRKPERCALYDWFLSEADGQSQGTASKNELATRRVINIANKLADHHPGAGREQYQARVNYLVVGDGGPYHFCFRISADKLEGILAEGCRS